MADGRVTVETLTTRKVIRGGKEGVEKSDKSGQKQPGVSIITTKSAND